MTPEISIALGAAFVSLCALFVSISQLIIQRKHNKLSVKPFLSEDIYTISHSPFKFEVSNCGAGPAIIQGFSVTIGNDKLDFPSTNILHSAFKSIGIDDYKSINVQSKGNYIKPNTTLVLFEIDQNLADQIRNLILKISWNIQYESIYGESSTLTIDGNNIV